MRLDVLPAARVEVEVARVYLNEQAPGMGDSFVSEVEHAFDDIVVNSELHSFVETLPSRYGYRRVHLRKYHYIIVYRVVGDVAVVFAVSHSGRRPNYWLGRL